MDSEIELRDLLEQFLERSLEPRLRKQLEELETVTQADFDELLLPASLLRGVIDEWEHDVKVELGYDALPLTFCEDAAGLPLTPDDRERWVAELSAQLGVTRERLGKMDLEEIFRRIREL
jgi:hypothetical protein